MADEYDILVIGAGTAGLPCAIAAAEAGARVLLVDKADRIGGTLQLSGGHMSAAGARRQLESGIEGDTPAAHAADIDRISEHSVERHDLVTMAVENAASTVDWLDDHGFAFHPSTPRIVYGHEPYSVARTYYGVDEARTTLQTLVRIIEPYLQSGAIELRLGTAVTKLLSEDGVVVGVVLDVGHDDVPVRARATVLATGGFGSNPELFAELDGRGAPLVSAAMPTSTGDGLVMARQLGGAVAGVGTYLPTFGGMPHPDDPERVQWVDRPLLVATERVPWEVYVDRKGRRFVAEDDESIDRKERALTKIDGLTFWQILDDRAVSESRNIIVGWSADDLRTRANTRPGVREADTVGDLAELAGIDAAGLVATIEAYNAAVATGIDPNGLGRRIYPSRIDTPPYYAIQNHGITLITFAGLDVDASLAVRRTDGSTIAGLYAIGELLGSAATMGNSFCSGMLVGPCLTFGRLLGARLAKEVA